MFTLVRWKNVNDKDITDKTKFNIIGKDIVTPSLVGLIPELEYFKKRNEISVNDDVDPLVAIATKSISLVEETTEVINALNEPQQLRQFDISYEITMRPDADLLETIREYEINSNNSVFPLQKQFKYMMFYVMGIKKVIEGGDLTPYQQSISEKIEAKGLRMWKNWMTAISKEDAVITGDLVSIGEDWETIDPENEIS